MAGHQRWLSTWPGLPPTAGHCITLPGLIDTDGSLVLLILHSELAFIVLCLRLKHLS